MITDIFKFSTFLLILSCGKSTLSDLNFKNIRTDKLALKPSKDLIELNQKISSIDRIMQEVIIELLVDKKLSVDFAEHTEALEKFISNSDENLSKTEIDNLIKQQEKEILNSLYSFYNTQHFWRNINVVQSKKFSELEILRRAKTYFDTQMKGVSRNVRIAIYTERRELKTPTKGFYPLTIFLDRETEGYFHIEGLGTYKASIKLKGSEAIGPLFLKRIVGDTDTIFINEKELTKPNSNSINITVVHELQHLIDYTQSPELFKNDRVSRDKDNLDDLKKQSLPRILDQDYQEVLDNSSMQKFLYAAALELQNQSFPNESLQEVGDKIGRAYPGFYQQSIDDFYTYEATEIERSAYLQEAKFCKKVLKWSVEDYLQFRTIESSGIQFGVWPKTVKYGDLGQIQVFGPPLSPTEERHIREIYRSII